MNKYCMVNDHQKRSSMLSPPEVIDWDCKPIELSPELRSKPVMPHGQRVTRAHELPQRFWSGTTCMTSLGAIPIQPSQRGYTWDTYGYMGYGVQQPTNMTWHSLKMPDQSYGSLCKIGTWSPLGGPSASSGS